MILAYDYPILGLFWTMLMFFAFIVWLTLSLIVIIDILRSRDLSGWGKSGWMLFVLVLPVFGVLMYVLARGNSMSQRQIAQLEAQDDVESYVRRGSPTGIADELTKLSGLKESGVITADEFDRQKAKLMA